MSWNIGTSPKESGYYATVIIFEEKTDDLSATQKLARVVPAVFLPGQDNPSITGIMVGNEDDIEEIGPKLVLEEHDSVKSSWFLPVEGQDNAKVYAWMLMDEIPAYAMEHINPETGSAEIILPDLPPDVTYENDFEDGIEYGEGIEVLPQELEPTAMAYYDLQNLIGE